MKMPYRSAAAYVNGPTGQWRPPRKHRRRARCRFGRLGRCPSAARCLWGERRHRCPRRRRADSARAGGCAVGGASPSCTARRRPPAAATAATAAAAAVDGAVPDGPAAQARRPAAATPPRPPEPPAPTPWDPSLRLSRCSCRRRQGRDRGVVRRGGQGRARSEWLAAASAGDAAAKSWTITSAGHRGSRCRRDARGVAAGADGRPGARGLGAGAQSDRGDVQRLQRPPLGCGG